MRPVIKTSPYFKAYALSATERPEQNTGSKSQNKQFARVINRVVVSPLTSSYAKKTSINKINIPAIVHSPDKNWFISYE
ncbi:MAG TPA: hypothetical protein VGC95_07505 [Chitinophagaceae bacterium]